jgi:hypothetical protein
MEGSEKRRQRIHLGIIDLADSEQAVEHTLGREAAHLDGNLDRRTAPGNAQ